MWIRWVSMLYVVLPCCQPSMLYWWDQIGYFFGGGWGIWLWQSNTCARPLDQQSVIRTVLSLHIITHFWKCMMNFYSEGHDSDDSKRPDLLSCTSVWSSASGVNVAPPPKYKHDIKFLKSCLDWAGKAVYTECYFIYFVLYHMMTWFDICTSHDL